MNTMISVLILILLSMSGCVPSLDEKEMAPLDHNDKHNTIITENNDTDGSNDLPFEIPIL